MSVKKQVSTLCKTDPFYEEKPEEFLDETDIDGIFTTSFLTFPSSGIKKYVLAKFPIKNLLHSSCSNPAI